MATETLRPNAVGDECNIPDEDGAACPDHYQNVDEVEADENTTGVKIGSNDSFCRDLYNLPAHSGSGTINKITLYFRIKGYGASGKEKGAIKSDSTVTETAEKDAYADYGYGVWHTYSKEWATNPAPPGTDAWTWADIDALQIGIALKYYSACTQVYVEVDYTAVTEKTSSDAGSGADAYVSLEKTEAKSSSDTGSGVEGTPMPSAVLAGNETGSGIEALIARLLTGDETGTSVEVGNLLRAFFASELGRGSDSLIAKIETPTKGGGMKLWT